MLAVKSKPAFSWARISAAVVGMNEVVPGLEFEDSASPDGSWRGVTSRPLPLRSALEVIVGVSGMGRVGVVIFWGEVLLVGRRAVEGVEHVSEGD
jgi:hypothetical protein